MPCYNNIIKNTRDTKHYEQMIPNQMINKLKDCEVDFMKAVIAIDSFKGSLSSFEAGNSAAEGIRRVYPDAQIEVRPLADGGEGTVEALTLGCAGQLTTVTVTGPLGKPVSCQYGIVDSTRTAIIEMSGAARYYTCFRHGAQPALYNDLRCRRSHPRCDYKRLPPLYCGYRRQCHQ